jgi:hypothetical protein
VHHFTRSFEVPAICTRTPAVRLFEEESPRAAGAGTPVAVALDEIRLAAIQRCLRAGPLTDRLIAHIEREHEDHTLETDVVMNHIIEDLRAGGRSRGELARLARAIASEIGRADRLVKNARKRHEREQRAWERWTRTAAKASGPRAHYATEQIANWRARADAEHAILREYIGLRARLHEIGRVVLDEAEHV